MDFWVDIESPEEHEIIKRGAKIKISGTVRKREPDGSMRSGAPVGPQIKLYIVLQSEGSDSSNRSTWGTWMLYREMVWVETDGNGKFAFEINTRRFPILHNILSGAASNDEFMTAKEYRVGYSDNPGLQNLKFTSKSFLILEPKVLASVKSEMKKLLGPLETFLGPHNKEK